MFQRATDPTSIGIPRRHLRTIRPRRFRCSRHQNQTQTDDQPIPAPFRVRRVFRGPHPSRPPTDAVFAVPIRPVVRSPIPARRTMTPTTGPPARQPNRPTRHRPVSRLSRFSRFQSGPPGPRLMRLSRFPSGRSGPGLFQKTEQSGATPSHWPIRDGTIRHSLIHASVDRSGDALNDAARPCRNGTPGPVRPRGRPNGRVGERVGRGDERGPGPESEPVHGRGLADGHAPFSGPAGFDAGMRRRQDGSENRLGSPRRQAQGWAAAG